MFSNKESFVQRKVEAVCVVNNKEQLVCAAVTLVHIKLNKCHFIVEFSCWLSAEQPVVESFSRNADYVEISRTDRRPHRRRNRRGWDWQMSVQVGKCLQVTVFTMETTHIVGTNCQYYCLFTRFKVLWKSKKKLQLTNRILKSEVRKLI